jgi:large subunit ribosomal protein L37Ae
MSSTKKVKTAGRFGSRYGIGVRKRWLKVSQKQAEAFECPSCGYARVKREAAGIFDCRKCGSRFSGGAYYPQTLTGRIVSKMVTQRSFLSNVGELLAATNAQLKGEDEPGTAPQTEE